jgi:hypothetical protein
MYLWYMFLDDIKYLVEEFCTNWSNKVKHVLVALHEITIIICHLI